MSKKLLLMCAVIVLSVFVFSELASKQPAYDDLKDTNPDAAASILLSAAALDTNKAEYLLFKKQLSSENDRLLSEIYLLQSLNKKDLQLKSVKIDGESKLEMIEIAEKKTLKTKSIELSIEDIEKLARFHAAKNIEIDKTGKITLQDKENTPITISENVAAVTSVSGEGSTGFIIQAKQGSYVDLDIDGMPISAKEISYVQTPTGNRIAVTNPAGELGEFKIKSGNDVLSIQPTSTIKPTGWNMYVDSQVIIEKNKEGIVSRIYTQGNSDGFIGKTSDGTQFSSATGELNIDYTNGILKKISGNNFIVETNNLDAEIEAGEFSRGIDSCAIRGKGKIDYKEKLGAVLKDIDSTASISETNNGINFKMSGEATIKTKGFESELPYQDSSVEGYLYLTEDVVAHTRKTKSIIKPTVESEIEQYASKYENDDVWYAITDDFETYKQQLKDENLFMMSETKPEEYDATGTVFMQQSVRGQEAKNEIACVNGVLRKEGGKVTAVASGKLTSNVILRDKSIILVLGNEELYFDRLQRSAEYVDESGGLFTTTTKVYGPLEYICKNDRGIWKFVPSITNNNEQINIVTPTGIIPISQFKDEKEFNNHIRTLSNIRYLVNQEVQEYTNLNSPEI